MKINRYACLLFILLFAPRAFAQTAEIGNFVWEDMDGDGLQDGLEPGIPNVAVTLTGTDQGGNPVVLNTTTNTSGLYLFQDLAPGTYQITFGYPSGGYLLTSQNQGGDGNLNSDPAQGTLTTPPTVLVAGESDLTWDAGFYKMATLKSFVWNDLDKNGLQNGGEPGIPNQFATLSGTTGDGNPVSRSLLSDANGDCLFNNLMPGIYKLTFSYPPGCQTASPKDQGSNDTIDCDIHRTTLSSQNETLRSGEINENYDAGFYEGIEPDLMGSKCGPGKIAVNILSSTATPIIYAWESATGNSGNGTSGSLPFDIGALTSGTYTVTTTDGFGCSASATTTVVIAPDLVLSTLPTNVLCNGANTGSIDLTVTGGTPGYTYLWSNGVTVLDLSNLFAGTYTVTVTDVNGCTKTHSTTISQPTAINLSETHVNVLCNGASTGSIDLTVMGGTGVYTYTWSNGGTSQDMNGLAAGTYTVTATDANACTKTRSATITQPTALSLTVTAGNALCNGGNTGSIDLTVMGGTGAYTYLWSNNATSQDLTNLVSGTYTVTVTDANACTKTRSATITQPTALALSVTQVNVLCNGANTGSINLTVTGGTGVYLYAWTTGGTTQDMNGLVAGTYTVTVTDANACTKTRSATISQPTALSLSETHVNVLCNGGNTGSIDLTVTGGVSPYNYNWGSGITTQDRPSLPAGTYTVTVTDANACTSTRSATITQPSAITLSFFIYHLSCGGTGNDGAIDLTANGGTSPYVYNWSNAATTEDIFGLSEGTYAVTATDANNCISTHSGSVNTGFEIAQSSFNITNTSCQLGASDGAIAVSTIPPNAQPPLIFSWQGPNGYTAAQQDISGLAVGDYFLSITDANSCGFFATVTVGKSPSSIVLNPVVTPISCFGACDGAIDLVISNGVSPYTYLWNNGNTNQDLSNLCSGIYTISVVDNVGCTKTAIATVLQPSNLLISNTLISFSCLGTVTIDLSVSGGTPGYFYEWSNGVTSQDLTGVAAGTYTCTVTDNASCTKTTSINVPIINPLSASAVVNTVSCFGLSNGAINLTVSGGTAPYTYLWSNNATSQDLTNLVFGFYCCTVTDATGCSVIPCYVVSQPTQLVFDIVSLSNDCNSEVLSGPNQPNGSYAWSGPNGFTANTQSVTAQFSGLYSLTITNANGCTATDNYLVTLAGSGACGRIRGRLIYDEVKNCLSDPVETGLEGWLIRAEGPDTLYGVTNAVGDYHIGVPVGTYTMKALPPNGLWQICPGGTPVTLVMPDDTVSGPDFYAQSEFFCPSLSVSIGVNQLRRCFSNNAYQVEYCNEGTTPAQDAFVLLTLDPGLTFYSSTIPSVDLGNNVRRFELGDLGVGECGAFSVRVTVNCSVTIGQTLCTEAHIFPDSTCNTNPLWSGASLDVRSICEADSLRFVVKNVGTGDMTTVVGYIVVEDAIMFMSAPLPLLPAGDSIIISFPATGSTWRLEVEQEIFHPYPMPLGLSVEACTTSPGFSTGFVNQFSQNDEPPWVDVDCSTVIGSYDPNDKQGFPIGYGPSHYVRPGTDIEYLVRFQNTGTDTAFTVQIIDTLSAWLDPATIRFGASSHPYRYDLNGEGVVHFIFENILLPDSNTNEVASHGFAKFIIKPRFDAPLETVIENTAAIYFDFNDPVFTNTTFHRLGENFITVGVWQPFVPEATVIAIPNPFSEETTLEVKGLRRNDALRLQVFDLQGNTVREMTSESASFNLKKGGWQSGIYLFKITQNGRLVGNGKLVVEKFGSSRILGFCTSQRDGILVDNVVFHEKAWRRCAI